MEIMLLEKKIKSKNRIDSKLKLKKSLSEAINNKTDIIEIIGMMNFTKVLKEATLKDHHLILLPLVLLRLKKSSRKGVKLPLEQNLLTNSKGGKKWKTQVKCKNILSKDQKPEVNGVDQERGQRGADGHLQDQKIYNNLKNYKPKNGLESLFNEEILRYLSLVYEQQ